MLHQSVRLYIIVFGTVKQSFMINDILKSTTKINNTHSTGGSRDFLIDFLTGFQAIYLYILLLFFVEKNCKKVMLICSYLNPDRFLENFRNHPRSAHAEVLLLTIRKIRYFTLLPPSFYAFFEYIYFYIT